jgi:hypothetical protein
MFSFKFIKLVSFLLINDILMFIYDDKFAQFKEIIFMIINNEGIVSSMKLDILVMVFIFNYY